MDNSILIQQLFYARKLSTQQDYESFQDALQKLQKNIDINDICEICKVFYDETEDDEVMFEIIHLIEQLCGDEYLKCIALCSPNMVDAHSWAMTLNKRILNSQEYFEKYIEIIKYLEDRPRYKILELLIDIKNDNPKRFAEKVDLILKQVKK